MAQCHKRAFVNHTAKAIHPHGPLRSRPETSPKTALFRCHLWGCLAGINRPMSAIFRPLGPLDRVPDRIHIVVAGGAGGPHSGYLLGWGSRAVTRKIEGVSG